MAGAQKWAKMIFLGVLLTAALSAPLSAQTWDERLWGQEQYWLHFGLRGGGDFRLYSPIQSVYTTGFTFDAGALLMLQAAPWLGIQAEALFTMDFAPILDINDRNQLNATRKKITASSFMFPVVFIITFRPDDWLIAPLGGFYISIPLQPMQTPISIPLQPMQTPNGKSRYQWRYIGNWMAFGWTAGIEVGRKVGTGTLFTDIRFIGDFDNMVSENGAFKARRSGMSISLGYKWWMKKKVPKEAAAE